MRWLARLFAARKDGVLGINRRNVDLVRRRNPRRFFPVANEKLLAKEALAAAGVPVAPTLAVFATFGALGELDGRLHAYDEFVVKPGRGSGGRGILVIAERERVSDGGRDDRFRTAGGRWVTRDELRRHIADIVFGVYSIDRPDCAFVEPRLKPHPFFAALFAGGLSDVRVITVDERPALSMIRVPTVASGGRANLHQGAIGLGVDLETGRVHRAYLRKRLIDVHPDTGEPLIGQQVPGWDGIRAMAETVARALPLKYLGIDIVVDRALGPLVLEVNARPGLEIQNVTGVPLRALFRQMGATE